MKINIDLPATEKIIRQVNIGDIVAISGLILTARDKAHKYIYENMILKEPTGDEKELYDFLKKNLRNGAIYHCGPIVASDGGSEYKVTSAGPTTSIREEFYTHHLIKEFSIRAIIGKGGMGKDTLQAMKDYGCVYLHAVGGGAVVSAGYIKSVVDVKKKEFGTPEAMWLLDVDDFTGYASMDSKGNSIHDRVMGLSKDVFTKLYS